jgi:acetyl-CoA carboxylase beta subunit
MRTYILSLSIFDNALKQTKQNIRYDREAPRNFQRADYLQDRGQLDAVVRGCSNMVVSLTHIF